MNLSQIVRKARLEVDAIRANGAVSALWSDEEVIDAANTAMDNAARLIRLADSNILTTHMKSTDSSVDMVSEVYSPTSLAITNAQIDYTLPPDCVRVDSITPLTSGYEGIRFYPAGIHQKGWIDQSTLTATDLSTVSGSEQIFYYIIVGARTLRIRPVPTETFDVEVAYQFRPQRLQNYSTGTVQLTQSSTSVHGLGGTAWLTSGIRGPADLVLDTAANVSGVKNGAAFRFLRTSSVVSAVGRAFPKMSWNRCPAAACSTPYMSSVQLYLDEKIRPSLSIGRTIVFPPAEFSSIRYSLDAPVAPAPIMAYFAGP